MPEIPNLDPATLQVLEQLALARGCSVEQLVVEAIDQYVIRQNSGHN